MGRWTPPTPVAERFWSQVQKEPGPCWMWRGSVHSSGYGRFRPSTMGERRPYVRAHRFAYELARGHVPEGLCVCHACDTPLCVNPDHLWLGTDYDNAQDKIAKGRHARGERSATCRVSDAAVREIRRLAATGRSGASLAREFSLSETHVSAIVQGRRRVYTDIESGLPCADEAP